MKKLFNNPKPALYIILVFVALILFLFSVESRGHEAGNRQTLSFHAGSAVIRGETPVIGVNIACKECGPVRTDYEFGFHLIGESTGYTSNSNQFVAHAMIVDGYKRAELGMGFAYFNVPSEYTCQTSFSLMARYRFTDRVHIQLQHYSSAGSCRPNKGRDLLTLGWRF